MFDKLASIEQRYEDLTAQLGDPSITKDISRYRQVSREHAHMTALVEAWRTYQRTLEELEETELLLQDDDPDMRAMAEEERSALLQQKEELEEQLKRLLIPPDPNDGKNVLLEIRAGAGGDEASLFSGDLLRMYSRFGEARGWRFEQLSASMTEVGGFKEVITMVKGDDAWSRLKFEAGVHRVQRVPSTESQGRIHTSTVTVALMPEAEDVDIHVDQNDLRIDVFRAGGPGGQSVNTTDSAVRITHLPTGTTVICQDEKSQHKNKAKAMKVLRSRLLAAEEARAHAEQADARRAQVGTGDRSERIRTYNFPQGRLTDHRIGLTLYSLERIIQGDANELFDALAADAEARALQGLDDDE